MAGIHQIAVDYIISKITGGKIKLGSILSYQTRYDIADLADDDLVTKYLLLATSATFPDPVVITVAAVQNVKFTRDYVFFGYDTLLGNDVNAFVVVKDLDPIDGTTIIFRRSNTATVSFTKQDDLIDGNIMQLYAYLEPDPEDPTHTLNEQYIIIHKI